MSCGHDFDIFGAPPIVIAAKPKGQYKVLLDYLLMKVDQQDWHGVADAAMDMRELLARHPDADK